MNRGNDMNKKFLEAVKAYVCIVEEACDLLITYIEKEEHITILNKYDLYDYLHRSHRIEFIIGERRYYFHGAGCTVFSNNMAIIDWDFGCRSWWCGVQPFKMSRTLKNSMFEEAEYHDCNFIKYKCEQYLLEELMYYYKGQYYIDLLKFGCKKIEFPINYDRVLVEYKGVTRTFPKCKSIDKFIRKSNAVYEKISELQNNYIFIFFNKNIEVAKIPYNDIAYPDSAVKIMNEEVLKPHIVEKWKNSEKWQQ